MSQFFATLWENAGTLDLFFYCVIAVIVGYKLVTRYTATCPKCGSGFDRVIKRPGLHERITNYFSINSRLDASLADKSDYKCKGCNFKIKNLSRLKNKAIHKSLDSETPKFK